MTDTLTTALQGHDRYFARVIETIPSDLYKHTVSEDADGAQEGKYAKNRKMPLSAEERKTISKAKKSEKYAAPPAASSSAVAVAAPEADDEEPVKAPAAASSSGSSLDDLRQRLQARIQGMKSQRVSNKPQKGAKNGTAAPAAASTENSAATAAEASGSNKTLSSSEKKNKHKLEAKERQEAAKRVRRVGTAINDATDVSILSLGSQESSKFVPETDDLSVNTGSVVTMNSSKAGPVEGSLQFNLIAQSTVLGAAAGEGELAAKAGKPKGNKIQRLQRMLAEAEKKRQRMKQFTAHGGEEGMARLQGEKWNDALKSAKGERTLIVGSSSIEGSEGKLKAAMKKIEKRKAKSAEKWGDRIAAVEDTEKLKIQKREGNIKQRQLKMKGIELPEEEAAATNAKGEPVGPGSGRKRLYHVLKYGESNREHEASDSKGGKGGAGGGGGGKGGPPKSQGNRAGFEGKKKEYLNK